MEKGYVLGPAEGVSPDEPEVKASAASTGGSLTLIESHTTGGAPLHVHTREDECFYVLEGSISAECGDDVFEAGPGSFVFLPRGIQHAWDVSSESARVLIITAPAGLDAFLREFHAAEGDARSEVAARYGIQFLPG